MAAMSSALASGMAGTYQPAAGSSVTTPPAAHSTICATSDLHEPQPLAARVASITPVTDLTPPATVAAIVFLVTPLQLQICVWSSNSAADTSAGGPPRSNSSRIRSCGSGILPS